MADFNQALSAACRDSEADFIRLGRELESIHHQASAMLEEAMAMAEGLAGGTGGNGTEITETGGNGLEIGGTDIVRSWAGAVAETGRAEAAGRGKGLLGRIEGLVKASLVRLDSRRGRVAGHLERIETMTGHLDRLHDMCEVMEKQIMHLRVLGFNIRVESARSMEAREMFGVVSDRIGRLSEKISGIADRIRSDTRSASRRQLRAHHEIAEGLRRLDGLAVGIRHAVGGSLTEITRLMESAMAAVAEARSRSRTIADGVGEVVVGIQVHDSMSQRVQHIVSALADAVDMSAGDDGVILAEVKGSEKRQKAAGAIIDLQMAHLDGIIADLERIHGRTRYAFDRIGREVEGMTDVLPSESEGAGAGEGDSRLDALRGDLLSLHDLLGKAGGLMKRIHETAAAAADTTQRLAQRMVEVEDIGFETRLIALNAIIKAAHLGNMGGTLDVLAGAVKVISSESEGFVEEVRGVLTEVAGGVRDMDETAASGAAPRTGGDETGLEAGIREMGDAYARLRSASGDLLQRAMVVGEGIQQSVSSLDFLPALADRLSSLRDQLADIRSRMALRDGGAVVVSEENMRRLEERYTMRQERGIHRRMLGAAPAGGAQAPEALEAPEDAAREPAAGDKDLGDNVELF